MALVCTTMPHLRHTLEFSLATFDCSYPVPIGRTRYLRLADQRATPCTAVWRAFKPSARNRHRSPLPRLQGRRCSEVAGVDGPSLAMLVTYESGDSKVFKRCDGIPTTNLRCDNQLENIDAGQFNVMLFGLGIGALRIEVPLLTYDLMK